MEKQGEMPPAYEQQTQQVGYGQPQAPPPYNQPYPPNQPGYPPQQVGYPPQQAGYPPQQGYPQQPGYHHPGQYQQQFQQYPNVIVQQPVAVTAATGAQPPDHMTAAIFVTLCCFWPTGIIAIMKASEARNAWYRGDHALANSQARSAKTMVNVSIIAGICSIIVVGVIIGVYISMIQSTYDDGYYDD